MLVYRDNITPIDVEIHDIKKMLQNPFIKPHYRISILTPDEQVSSIIPEQDITIDGINYTEEYQNGQRRNISLTLINADGKYTPSVNGLWVNSRFKFDVGFEMGDNIIWFSKGIYIMGNVTLTRYNSDKTVTIQLQDKFAIFEGMTGTLETAYEVELGSNILDAIQGLLNSPMYNGYIYDYKEIIFDPSFYGKRTQSTIRVEQGEKLSKIIEELATQLSAEYYYNAEGNLTLLPLNETTNDRDKPIIWEYPWLGRDLHNVSLNYANEEIINCVKVVGDNIDSAVYSAFVTNNNPASPICVERIGIRLGDIIRSSSVWSDELAYDLANYHLRLASFAGVNFECSVSFNPILTVNNLCEVEGEFLKLKRETLLITSISYSSESGEMSVKFCNTDDLPTSYDKK